MFDTRIINLDTGSYLHMIPKNSLVNVENNKKKLYLQACLECGRSFITMLYSADRIPGVEALVAPKRLTVLISFKLKQKYSELCGFVGERM